MEKFCFGTLARILLSGCKLEVKQYELGENLLKVFNEVYGETAGATKISRLFNCVEGLSPAFTITPAREMKIEDVKAGFASYVLPLLDENKYPLIILAVRHIILMDGDIKDDTSIGIMTKKELKVQSTFDFIGTVAGFLQYSCICFSNKDGNAFINQITPNYIDGFIKDVGNITLAKTTIKKIRVMFQGCCYTLKRTKNSNLKVIT